MGVELCREGSADPSPSVLITGAAGFIGAGLARALASQMGGPLTLLDQSEQGLIDLSQTLAGSPREYQLVLGNVAESATMRSVLKRHRPADVIHAAAYKNVVLLEHHLEACIRNNTLASFELAHAARSAGVERFLLISTDKSVEPRSIMGAAKRAAELLTLSLARPGFRANAVRLGNVLGSTGSVLPLFEQQLREGLPLTITHPEASRWFFSLEAITTLIREALEASAIGRILIPPQSAPTRIVDLARSLSNQAAMAFIGLRPGEKLTESFVGSDEVVEKRLPSGIAVVRTRSIVSEESAAIANRLRAALDKDDRRTLLEELQALVPEYVPSETVLEAVRT